MTDRELSWFQTKKLIVLRLLPPQEQSSKVSDKSSETLCVINETFL